MYHDSEPLTLLLEILDGFFFFLYDFIAKSRILIPSVLVPTNASSPYPTPKNQSVGPHSVNSAFR